MIVNLDIIDGTRINEVCTTSLSTCVDKHAECNGTVCDCADGFTYNGTNCGTLYLLLF